MKKYFIIYLLLFFVGLSSSDARSIIAYLTFNTFYSPEKGSFVETYLSVDGTSAKFVKNKNGKFQASIEVSISFSADSTVKYKDRYNLLSKEVDDSNNVNFNFLDQQRISLPNGKYTFKLSISDNNNKQPPFVAENAVELNYSENQFQVSDIQLIESYQKSEVQDQTTKSGYTLIPYVNNFYPQSQSSLKFYAEIYNADKVLISEPFLVKYYVETYNQRLPVAEMNFFSRQEPKTVNPILSTISLKNLPSGNYYLVLEARNKSNELLAKKSLFFQRSNNIELNDSSISANIDLTFAGQYTNKDTLAEHIRSLRPIANETEKDFIDNQLKTAELNSMQLYLYKFWLKRNKNAPAAEWKNYAIAVVKVNKSYGNKVLHLRGYDTDRGRVYLKYGPPNDIDANHHEQEAYPYEIWHYYKLNDQTNKKFVFYNRDLITNEFSLLHSDAAGETNDPQWQFKIFSRTRINSNTDNTKVGNNKLDDRLKNPR